MNSKIEEFSPVEKSEKIEELLENEPDRRKKEHRVWLEEVNNLMDIYNKWAQETYPHWENKKIYIHRK